MNTIFMQELSSIVSERLGYHLGADHIHSDDPGYYYYIQKLQPGWPLLMMHYRGPLMLVLPHADFQRLEAGEVTAAEYVNEARFSYGRYWGGGSLIGGGYWQPLEDEPGIHDRARLSRYLHILSCRTFYRSSGYRPSAENCQTCPLNQATCPFSDCNQTGDWAQEVQEPDMRVNLYKAITNRLQLELKLEACGLYSHGGDPKEVWLVPGFKKDTATIYVNDRLLNTLLYRPEERDWEDMAASLTFVAKRMYYQDWDKRLVLTAEDDQYDRCVEFWGNEVANWHQADSQPEPATNVQSEQTTDSPLTTPKIVVLIQRFCQLFRG